MAFEQIDFVAELRSAFMASELASELYVDEKVDGAGNLLQVDTACSVSALVEPTEATFVDSLLDEQFLRHQADPSALEVF